MKPLVLYHDNCPDGFTAAWAVWQLHGDDAEYRGVNYGQEPPTDVKGRHVYIVDFSYPRAVMNAIADVAKSVVVYDHHKTAEADLHDWHKGEVIFDMDRSGAGITWDSLHNAPRPELIDYIEDADLWRFKLPYARQIREVVFLTKRTFEAWDALANRLAIAFDECVMIGDALLTAKRVRVAKVCENVRWFTFYYANQQQGIDFIYVPVVNASWDMSEIGEYLCEKYPNAPAGGYYFDRADKRQWGLRSRGDFDVSILCKAYGGGGHAAAAGFTSEIGWEPNATW